MGKSKSVPATRRKSSRITQIIISKDWNRETGLAIIDTEIKIITENGGQARGMEALALLLEACKMITDECL